MELSHIYLPVPTKTAIFCYVKISSPTTKKATGRKSSISVKIQMCTIPPLIFHGLKTCKIALIICSILISQNSANKLDSIFREANYVGLHWNKWQKSSRISHCLGWIHYAWNMRALNRQLFHIKKKLSKISEDHFWGSNLKLWDIPKPLGTFFSCRKTNAYIWRRKMRK